MTFFAKSIEILQLVALRLLKHAMGSAGASGGGDGVAGRVGSSRIIAYFAHDLIAFSLEAPNQTLSLGKAHALLLELPQDGETIVVRRSPAQAPVLRMEFASKSIGGWLVCFLFGLNTQLSSILDVKRNLKVNRSNGSLCLASLSEVTSPGDWPERYTRSLRNHINHVIELAARRQSTDVFNFETPLISFVVPIFNAKQEHLDELLRSFRLQADSAAELIFSDDKSTSGETIAWLETHEGASNVSIVRNKTQAGISCATNSGLAMARGEWVSFIDHDDALLPFSVGELVRAIRENPDSAFFYTDEIITDEKLAAQAYFLKPAWDPVLLSGVNYINHLSIYKKDLLLECGGLRSDFDGSQDYDLLLRYTASVDRSEIKHVPFPAYLWRRSKTSYSARFIEKATLNARKALSEHFSTECDLEVVGAVDPNLHHVRFDKARKSWPKVSIVIPSRDAPDLIGRLLEGLFEETDYPLIEVIVIDNGTTNSKTLEIYESYKMRGDFHVNIEVMEFNFSAAVNKGIRATENEFVLLLNNDVEILSSDWLKEMISCFDYGEVGVVGAKLIYPSGKLQHAGVIVGLGQLAGHWFIGEEANFPGPMGRLWVRQTFSCVTGAVMLLSRRCIDAVGSFDETNFAIAYNDIDFCLRASNAGFRVVWTPFALLVHHESASRGSDDAPDKINRFRQEQNNLRELHRTELFEDPAFSPWYAHMHSHPAFLLRSELPNSR